MVIPPGIVFVARSSGSLLLPCAITYGALTVVCDLLKIPPSRLTLVGLSVLPRLLYLIVVPYLQKRKNLRDAQLNGAVLPPHIDVKQGEVARRLIENVKNGYPGELFLQWSEQYGQTFRLTVGVSERYFTTEPEHIKALLATQFDSFEKGPELFSQLKSLLGTGVFNSDGDTWKFHRSITRPFFSRERISDFEVFDRHAEDSLKQAKARLAEGYPIDFQDLVSRFTLDTATEFLFKNDVRSLAAGLPYPPQLSPLAKPNSELFMNHPSTVFVEAFLEGQNASAMRTRMGSLWPLKEFSGDIVRPYRKKVDEFVEPFLDTGLARKAAKEKNEKLDDSDSATLLDHLIEQTTDRQVIKDELVNLLVAGRDTTASLLTFAVYMLIEHPDITRRLREEMLSIVGPSARPSYDDIRDMKYLRAFLNEVLRLYPAVPSNSRSTSKPVVLPPVAGSNTPIYVPAGRRFLYSVFLMHRRKDLWGPDALEFDPDRFIDQRLNKYLLKNPFIFTPFNAGPRICLGQQFAYNEASFFLIRLLQQFSSFSLALDAQPPDSLPPKQWSQTEGPQGRDKIRPAFHLTMYVRGGLWLRMKEVNESEML